MNGSLAFMLMGLLLGGTIASHGSSNSTEDVDNTSSSYSRSLSMSADSDSVGYAQDIARADHTRENA
jgi:hypothetical protein